MPRADPARPSFQNIEAQERYATTVKIDGSMQVCHAERANGNTAT